jgi:transposase
LQRTSSIDALAARFDDPSVKLHAKQEIERVRLYTEQIGTVESALLAGVQERPDFQRLLTMPGVALMLGLTILYETGPVERFASARHYSSYCRVVPGIGASSGVVRRRGRQSKQGNPTLKWAFNQAATHAVRCYPRIRTYFDRQLAKHVGRAGKLVVYNTVAHKLCVAAFHILRDQVEYKEDLLFAS